MQLNSKETNYTVIKKKKKLGKRLELTFFQERQTKSQQVHGKVINTTDHQENRNQRHVTYDLC